MPTPVVGSFDGARITVNSILKRPGIIRERILSMTDQQFLTDQVLRKVQDIPSGSLLYNETTPLYADRGVLDVAEGGEIPLASTSQGTPKTAFSVKKALGIRITEEMRTRNDIDKLNGDITKVTNTMKAAWEDAFLASALAQLPSSAVSGGTWDSSTTVRRNLADALLAIELADTDSNNQTGVNKLGYEPDTLVLNHYVAMNLALNSDLSKYFTGSDRSAPADSMTLNGLLFGRFKVIKSWRMDKTKAIVLEAKTIGGIADERPLTVSGLHEEPNTESWRVNVVRSSAIFFDQPKAGIVLTGVGV